MSNLVNITSDSRQTLQNKSTWWTKKPTENGWCWYKPAGEGGGGGIPPLYVQGGLNDTTTPNDEILIFKNLNILQIIKTTKFQKNEMNNPHTNFYLNAFIVPNTKSVEDLSLNVSLDFVS